MKKIYWVAIAAIALGIVFLLSTSADVSTYGNFDKAKKSGQVTKIVGQLSKEKDMVYDIDKDANLFTFFMKDEIGNEVQVHYKGAKPQDFEMSDQIVVTGKFDEGVFHSDELLLKCPSKYKGEEELINAKQNG